VCLRPRIVPAFKEKQGRGGTGGGIGCARRFDNRPSHLAPRMHSGRQPPRLSQRIVCLESRGQAADACRVTLQKKKSLRSLQKSTRLQATDVTL
jgi:hypothetical protein